MAVAPLTHGIATGGTVGTTPCFEAKTINTVGADFLFVACTGDGAHPNGDVFTDSEGNTWTELPGYPAPGDGYPGATCQSRYFICPTPKTSATHTFTLTTVNCGQLHGSIAPSSWTGVKQVTPFTGQIWTTGIGSSPLTASLPVSVGFAISAMIIGFGDGNTGSNHGTVDGAWTALDHTDSVSGAGAENIVGLNLAYRIISANATDTVSWTYPGAVVSGTGGGIFSFLGASTPPPIPTTTSIIRRLRRFMLPWDNANRQKFISRLEIILQAGIGLVSGQGSDPIVMLRVSKDGGKTWGNEIQMQAGAMGEYQRRVYVNILGRGRNWVFEVSVSDPVDWQFIQCAVDVEEGTS